MAANNLLIAAKEVKNYDDAVRYYMPFKTTNDSVYSDSVQ
jgi:hypothetical protein